MGTRVHIVESAHTELHLCPLKEISEGQAFWYHDAICIVINWEPDDDDNMECMSLDTGAKFLLNRFNTIPPVHLSITAVPYQKR